MLLLSFIAVIIHYIFGCLCVKIADGGRGRDGVGQRWWEGGIHLYMSWYAKKQISIQNANIFVKKSAADTVNYQKHIYTVTYNQQLKLVANIMQSPSFCSQTQLTLPLQVLFNIFLNKWGTAPTVVMEKQLGAACWAPQGLLRRPLNFHSGIFVVIHWLHH